MSAGADLLRVRLTTGMAGLQWGSAALHQHVHRRLLDLVLAHNLRRGAKLLAQVPLAGGLELPGLKRAAEPAQLDPWLKLQYETLRALTEPELDGLVRAAWSEAHYGQAPGAGRAVGRMTLEALRLLDRGKLLGL